MLREYRKAHSSIQEMSNELFLKNSFTPPQKSKQILIGLKAEFDIAMH